MAIIGNIPNIFRQTHLVKHSRDTKFWNISNPMSIHTKVNFTMQYLLIPASSHLYINILQYIYRICEKMSISYVIYSYIDSDMWREHIDTWLISYTHIHHLRCPSLTRSTGARIVGESEGDSQEDPMAKHHINSKDPQRHLWRYKCIVYKYDMY